MVLTNTNGNEEEEQDLIVKNCDLDLGQQRL